MTERNSDYVSWQKHTVLTVQIRCFCCRPAFEIGFLHKAMSYKRMKEEARNLRAEVQQLLKQAKAADDEEDARYGKDKSGDELPEELSRRETRLQRIKEAKKALEQRAREEAQKSQEHNEPEKKAVPEDKAQYNFTDPESRIMKKADGFVQAYNGQAVVEQRRLYPTMEF